MTQTQIDPANRLNTALRESFRRALAEKHVLLLLAGVATSAHLLVFSPILDVLIGSRIRESGSLDNVMTAIEGREGPFLIATFLFFAAMAIVDTIIARLVVPDPKTNPLADGLRALLPRAVAVMWRQVCAAGWFILLLFPLFILALFLDTGQILAVAIIYVLVIIFPLTAAMGVAIVTAANDKSITIRDAFRGLGPYRWRFSLVCAAIFIPAQMLSGLLNLVFNGLGVYEGFPLLAYIVDYGLTLFISLFGVAIWLGVAARLTSPAADITV